MKSRPGLRAALCAAVPSMLTSIADAQVVALGNLLTTNSGIQSTNITGLTGGPYNRVTFTTNWSYNAGTPTSLGAAINFNAGAFTNIIAGLSSISGFANNANPTTLTAVCNLTMGVSSATALSMIRGQNALTLGYTAANWDNVTLNFSYVQRPHPIPSGVIALGVRGNTTSAFSIVPGGGTVGGFNPSVGLYSDDGYLIASNIGAAASTAGAPPTGVIIGDPSGDPGLTNLTMPEGNYYIFVGGNGTTFTPDDLSANVPGGALGGTLLGGVGDGGWLDPTIGNGQGHWYSFTIVPAPGSGAVLIAAGVLSARRQRRSKRR